MYSWALQNPKRRMINEESPVAKVETALELARPWLHRSVPRLPWCHLPRAPASTPSEKSPICAQASGFNVSRWGEWCEVNEEWIGCLWWWTEISVGSTFFPTCTMRNCPFSTNHAPVWLDSSQYHTAKDRENNFDFWSEYFRTGFRSPLDIFRLYGWPRSGRSWWVPRTFLWDQSWSGA